MRVSQDEQVVKVSHATVKVQKRLASLFLNHHQGDRGVPWYERRYEENLANVLSLIWDSSLQDYGDQHQ